MFSLSLWNEMLGFQNALPSTARKKYLHMNNTISIKWLGRELKLFNFKLTDHSTVSKFYYFKMVLSVYMLNIFEKSNKEYYDRQKQILIFSFVQNRNGVKVSYCYFQVLPGLYVGNYRVNWILNCRSKEFPIILRELNYKLVVICQFIGLKRRRPTRASQDYSHHCHPWCCKKTA
jgi:hypothetical protein